MVGGYFPARVIINKKNCYDNGGDFTTMMEGMVTDIILAREGQTRFEDWLTSNSTEMGQGCGSFQEILLNKIKS